MKQFLIKIVIFGNVIIASIMAVFLMADATTDPFYKKFTSSKQSSLILGSSRIAEGLNPSIINKELHGINSYNYAFTYNTSPYGPTYLNSIKLKLDTTVKNQIFILGVDPWVLSTESKDPNDLKTFDEQDNFLGTLKKVNSNPNFNYLIHNYSELYIKILYNNTPLVVRDDGFMKLTVTLTDEFIEHKKEKTLDNYRGKLVGYNFSYLRLEYLRETINYLQNFGQVYLVRPPIDFQLLEIENTLKSNFDDVINDLSAELKVPYFNFSTRGDEYYYADGHHLLPESADRLSKEIAITIKKVKH
ncbi:MAG: hypothetical protein ACJA1H_000290 [Glaciecola sp.]